MSSQNDWPISDASIQTRQKSVAISTAKLSDNPFILTDGAGLGGRKRKRDGDTLEDLLKTSFVVRPHPSTVFVKPHTLQPLILLPRSSLPLSCLDIASSATAVPQSRLFEAHVKILELEERMGSQPVVLIARLDDGRTLYAVEREERGLYVLCQMGSWVDLRKLEAAAIVSRRESMKTIAKGFGCSENPRDDNVVSVITSEASKYSKNKRLAIEAIQSMVKRPSTDLLPDSQQTTVALSSPVDSEETQVISETVTEDVITQPTATEIFENVRIQYFEALYLSKASLAYFAKGPLSRARAAFHLDYDSTLDMNDHIAFLESLILSTTLIDKKYRDGLPGCISTLDFHDHTADECDVANGKTRKRRSSKKMKRGKTGLYPIEEPLIKRWWESHDDDEIESGGPGTSRDELMKSRIAQLRIRETQLQMILILEVLALQTLASPRDFVEGGLPSSLPTGAVFDEKEKLSKPQKPDHLLMLIDVHIDRLCIWQSIALETGKIADQQNQSQNESLGTSANMHKQAADVLRDFCVEVIAPFFSARLPDHCDSINRKLGGPVVVTPARPRLSKSASFSSAPSRPGAATKRPVPVKPRRSLQRVLSEDRERRSMSRGPSRAISLMRSATIPGLKRESSEPLSLSSIPVAEPQPLQVNRGGFVKSKRFAQREVDLSSLAPEANLKAKKQAIIDAELKDAISALKRPNRELAGKVLAETAEKRSTAASCSRKSKRPIRNPIFQRVQISATPRTNRQKDVFTESQIPNARQVTEPAAISPSSLPRIPQSVVRPEERTKNPLLAYVQATPTRKSITDALQPTRGLLGVSIVDCGGCPPSSPIYARHHSADQFLAVPDSAVREPTTSSQTLGIQDTPMKRRPQSEPDQNDALFSNSDKENIGAGRRLRANEPAPDEIVGGADIYKSLGWDADDADDMV